MSGTITKKDLKCLREHLIGVDKILSRYGMGLGEVTEKKEAAKLPTQKERVDNYLGKL